VGPHESAIGGCFCGVFCSLAQAANPPMLKSGPRLPISTCPSRWKTYSLKDFADRKILVIIFTCQHCRPRRHTKSESSSCTRILKTGVWPGGDFAQRSKAVRLDDWIHGVQRFIEEMKLRAKEQAGNFPISTMARAETSQAYGVWPTPHVYIFDQDRVLRYIGRR